MNATVLGSVSYARAGIGGALMADWTANFAKARPFFRRDPRSDADWKLLLQELARHAYPRDRLAGELLRVQHELGAHEAALEHAKALRQPETYAVLTGQQAGLFGGPLYSLHKALTAIKLARELALRFPPHRFVPVFWVAGDDHDLDEIDHVVFLDANAGLQRLRVELPEPRKGGTAADTHPGEALEALRSRIEELLPGRAEELLAPYRDVSLSTGFARLIARQLSPLGLVVVDAPEVRPFGVRLIQRELTEFAATCKLVRDAGRALEGAGYEAALTEPRDEPHLFLDANGIRAKLEPEDAEGHAFAERSAYFAARGRAPETHPRSRLLLMAETHARLFSPAAALRPVLQDTAFPTAAVVLGPGEMAYWAQLAPLHDYYGAVWPMLVPRASLTLLDAKGEKAWRKLGVAPEDLFLPRGELEHKLSDGGTADAAIEAAREKVLAEFDRMHVAVREADKGLESLFAKARARIAGELERIGAKTRASLAQRDGPAAERLAYLANLAQPGGRPQERTLGWLPFVLRDPDLPRTLLELLDPFRFEHLIVHYG